MANLIKVEQVKTKQEGRTLPEYQPRETGIGILRQVFGKEFKFDEWGRAWRGVEFRFIANPSWSYRDDYPLKGIQMSAGDYGRKTIRRVMIRDGMIDADALKGKFAELKGEADALERREEESAEYHKKAKQLYDKIAKAVGYTERYDINSKVDLESHSPTEVEMEARINGTQLVAIEKLLGEQSVEITLIVPEGKAVEAYKILKGEG